MVTGDAAVVAKNCYCLSQSKAMVFILKEQVQSPQKAKIIKSRDLMKCYVNNKSN